MKAEFDVSDIPIAQSVKVSNLRKSYPKQKDIDLEKWIDMIDEKGEHSNMYVGRKGRIFITENNEKRIYHYPGSKWGNPFKVGTDLASCLQLYEKHVRQTLIKDLHELKGKRIGCFCDMKPYSDTKTNTKFVETCHTHVLIRLYKEFCC